MHAIVAKEIRPIMLPLAAVVAGGTMFGMLGVKDQGLPIQILVWLAGCAYLCSLPFGLEFQQRTLGLLLAHPLSRTGFWKQKTLLIISITAVLVVAYLVVSMITKRARVGPDLVSPILFFIVATICSACFWTLVARTVIGGATFTIATQLLALTGFEYATRGLERLLEPHPDFWAGARSGLFLVMSATYCLGFLRLGWRKFRMLEAVDAHGAAGLSERTLSLGRMRPAIGKQTLLRNLFIKELMLHYPLLLAAAWFVLCWFGILGLGCVAPEWQVRDFLTAMAYIFVVVIPVIAGTLTFAEERTLGTLEWHRALPASALRQWSVKVGVAFLVTFLLGAVVGLLLLVTTPGFFRSTFDEGVAAFVAVAGPLLAIAIWSSSFSSNSIRAASTAVFAAAGLFMLVMASNRLGLALQPELEMFVGMMAAKLQLDFTDFTRLYGQIGEVTFIALLAAATAVSLFESYRLHRHPGRRVLDRFVIEGHLSVIVIFAAVMFGVQFALLAAVLLGLVLFLCCRWWPELFRQRSLPGPVMSALVLGRAVFLIGLVLFTLQWSFHSAATANQPGASISRTR